MGGIVSMTHLTALHVSLLLKKKLIFEALFEFISSINEFGRSAGIGDMLFRQLLLKKVDISLKSIIKPKEQGSPLTYNSGKHIMLDAQAEILLVLMYFIANGKMPNKAFSQNEVNAFRERLLSPKVNAINNDNEIFLTDCLDVDFCEDEIMLRKSLIN